jgi:hypothetical protein
MYNRFRRWGWEALSPRQGRVPCCGAKGLVDTGRKECPSLRPLKGEKMVAEMIMFGILFTVLGFLFGFKWGYDLGLKTGLKEKRGW